MAKIRVGYQGDPGAFSEIAAWQLLDGLASFDNVELVAFRTFREMLKDLHSANLTFYADRLSLAVIPVENSLIGPVHENGIENYELISEYSVAILREASVRIVHNLISCPGTSQHKIVEVRSHPMALFQCHKFLRENADLFADQFHAVASDDTAGSVKWIMESGRTDVAAIASKKAAQMYGAKILFENIGDHAENYTRFFLLGLGAIRESAKFQGRADKMSIVFGVKNEPGAIVRCLMCFATRAINLTKITSRPIVGKPWDYLFYVDFIGDRDAENVQAALGELFKITYPYKVLGSYESVK